MAVEEKFLLSVVVVCRNEEANIARCLDSVLRAVGSVESGEVLVVDSASTDRTVEIASRYPVKLVLLKESWPLSPAAGRHSGFENARGEFVAFVDADMEIDQGWFRGAVDELRGDDRLVGVTGVMNQIFVTGGAVRGRVENEYRVPPAPAPARVLPGSAIFRRSAVEEAGGFHPFLRSEEEADLCYRLVKKGHALKTLPIPMADHYCLPRRSAAEISRRRRSGLYLGLGQVLRVSIAEGLFFDHLLRLRLFVIYAAFLAAGLAALVAGIGWGAWSAFLVWCAAAALGFFAFSMKKRSLREAGRGVLAWTYIVEGMARGFFGRTPGRSSYPKAGTREAPGAGGGE